MQKPPGWSGLLDLVGRGMGDVCSRGLTRSGRRREGQVGGRGVGRGAVHVGDGRGGMTRAHLSTPFFWARFHAGRRSFDLHQTCEVEQRRITRGRTRGVKGTTTMKL
jgi:hypothetical protein